MKKALVMIVEDEAIVGMDIKNNLTNYGYEVIGIPSSGKEAISLAIKAKPEIILMDIRLNGEMDGIETAKYLWKRLNVPIIYLTAHSEDKTLLEALKASPYGYLLKPFVPRELHASIQIALCRYEIEKKMTKKN
ncbi:MAG TPA: response regulator [Leptospiraceae bacterium]|nr:response regulator [Leptospiraceae bacterium]HRG76525.1 response regulator [Leptospiraceae bacterium]